MKYIRLHEDTGDTVGVGVTRGPAVLKVTAALGSNFTRNADGCTTVGDAAAVG